MEKLEYPKLVEWARPEAGIDPKAGIKASSPFAEIAFAFAINITRVRALAVLPGVVTAHALRVEKQKRGLPATSEDLSRGAMEVEQYTSINWVKEGMENLFGSTIIGAWTAFEVLAGDLWVKIVNEFPLLGLRALKADPDPDDNELEQKRKSEKEFAVVAQKILDPDFDIKLSMGDVLSEQFPMTKFVNIITAYDAIFRDSNVKKIISDRDVRALSAVRNALVHSAGKADKDFRRQVRNDNRFSSVGEDEFIPLIGSVTVELAEGAKRQGIKLIQYVDQWRHDSSTTKP